MSLRTGTQRRTWKERALSLLLTAALVAGLIPGLTLPASAEHWADAYLDQLVDWGVMRADQTANPDADLTRAEFFAVINRAYGYTETGYVPFTDVLETDWFYDDISIAYTAGYMAGTSATTASPNDPLTREQAFCILGRNMMLAEAPGENLAFADSRDISSWARGTIKAAADRYIVSGFPDNTLHPQDSISKGQMAVLISQCLGTPIRESGTYDLGGVFGNVTITAPNVTLRNATISGDLYISGGVGLGGIKLENVDVLGRIIVSSTGESEDGSASVIMRNVTADELLVDNMRNKTVTLRADGITDIANTIVRTNAYLEDNNTDDKGLMHIEVDGDPGLRLTLAGRIKEVVDKTPSSYIQAAQGTVAKLTIDEAATNSIVEIDRNTKIAQVNLDVAASVIGDGDIDRLNVNAPGSVVSMLPDDIYIRPGLNASIAGVIMDYQSAQEGSLDPRLLSGYPAAKDIAPTGFRADFAGNKKGTIYWAVSYVSDGSIGEDDLISPPSYGSKAVSNGSVAEPTGGEEVSAQVGNLVVGGSYYLSAILVDDMKERSPVKVISFSTPDNTVPAFAQGYPYMSRTTRSVSQVTVMPTKSCKLYYALLPQGAQAPTANELRAAAVTGNLGYGVRDVTKNTEDVFTVNSQRLEELKNYVLYLWLTDVDGANSSAVTSLSFSIPDETPPEFVVHPHVNGTPLATSVPMAATVNEDATIFWAVVPEGDNYPLPNSNSMSPSDNVSDPDSGQLLYSEYHTEFAKLCVASGMGALQRGQVAARANTEVTFNVGGLVAETAYDFYYVARDTAGNYTVQVYKLQGGLHTLDNSGPVVTQSFSKYPSEEAPNNPWSSTDIVLDFSENIRSENTHHEYDLLTLYNNRRENPTAFTQVLAASIVLYHLDPERPLGTEPGGEPVPLYGSWGSGEEPAHWVNYENVTVRTGEEGHVIVTFPGTGGVNAETDAAVKLANGEQYYFQFQYIVDTATPRANPLGRSSNEALNYHSMLTTEPHVIPVFTTVFSQVYMRNQAPDDLPEWRGDESGKNTESGDAGVTYARADLSFRLSPQSTRNTSASNKFDILLYLFQEPDDDNSAHSAKFDLYYRITDKNGKAIKGDDLANYTASLLKDYEPEPTDPDDKPDANGWFFLGSSRELSSDAASNTIDGVSIGKDFNGYQNNNTRPFRSLQNFNEDLYYEFVLSITKLNEHTESDKFDAKVTFQVYIEAGQSGAIAGLAGSPGERETLEGLGLGTDNGVTNIGLNQNDASKNLKISKSFTNPKAPEFTEGAPRFSDSPNYDDNNNTLPPYVYDDKGRRTALIGDTFGYAYVNLDVRGTVYYAVFPRSSAPTLRYESGNNVPPEDVWDIVPTDGTDERHGKDRLGQLPEGVTVSFPAVSQITSSASLAGAVIKSSQPYNSTQIYDRIDLTGLSPSTDYYIYFLLESVRQGNAPGTRPEVVSVYKFRTADSSAPRIKLIDNSASDQTVSVDTRGDSQNQRTAANLSWVVFTSYEGNKILEHPFTTRLSGTAPKYTDMYGNDMSAYFTGPNAIKTWYQALTTTYSATTAYGGEVPVDPSDPRKTRAEFDTSRNGYTVFDVLASNDDRSDLQDYIDRSMDNITRINSGSLSTNSGNGYIAPAYWMTDSIASSPNNGDIYLFLIAGHNAASEDGKTPEYLLNSYAVLDPISNTTKDAPVLEKVGGLVDLDTSISSAPYTSSSVVTLTFDRDLFWTADQRNYYKIVTGSHAPGAEGTDSEDGKKTVGVEFDVMPKSPSGSYGLSVSGRAISIDLSKITQDAYFDLMSFTGNIAAEGGSTADTLTIEIRKNKGEAIGPSGQLQTYYEPVVIVTYKRTSDERPNPIEVHSRPERIWVDPAATVPQFLSSSRIYTNNGELSGSTTSLEIYIDLNFDQEVNRMAADGSWAPATTLDLNTRKTGNNVDKLTFSSTSTPSNPSAYTLTLSSLLQWHSVAGMGESAIFELLPDYRICDKNGEVFTRDLITVTVTKIMRGMTAGVQVEVSFGNQGHLGPVTY